MDGVGVDGDGAGGGGGDGAGAGGGGGGGGAEASSLVADSCEYLDAGDEMLDPWRGSGVDNIAFFNPVLLAVPIDSPDGIDVRRRESVDLLSSSKPSYASTVKVDSAPRVEIVPCRNKMLRMPETALGESGNTLTICLLRVDFSLNISGEFEGEELCWICARRCLTTDI